MTALEAKCFRRQIEQHGLARWCRLAARSISRSDSTSISHVTRLVAELRSPARCERSAFVEMAIVVVGASSLAIATAKPDVSNAALQWPTAVRVVGHDMPRRHCY